MLKAELHGKVSRSGRTHEEHLEDTLTSAVFGALCYLPRDRFLAEILATSFPSFLTQETDWESAEIEFWPASRTARSPT